MSFNSDPSRWRAAPLTLFILATALLAFGGAALALPDVTHQGDQSGHNGWNRTYRLTILHNNDAESDLIDAGSGLEDFGGADRFGGVVHMLRREALTSSRRDVKSAAITLSSGDNFLAGPEFNASLDKGPPYYDAIGMDLIGYDAVCIGNHEFDFGPDVLENFIRSFERWTPFLSANLDVSGEPGLQDLADEGRIARSVIVKKRGRNIGVVGATTELLSFISSPRNVVVNDVVSAVQAEVDELTAQGVNIIIFIGHLQSIQEDLALAAMLSDIDVFIAGGGDELLANPGDLLLPGDEGDVFGSYPLWTTDADGLDVPVITTSGGYRYVGRFIGDFDTDGRLMTVHEDSGPVRVAGGDELDAVRPLQRITQRVVDPVRMFVAQLQDTIVATSEVALNGVRGDVRTVETNEGNLVADALLWQADQLAASFGAPLPDVALQNGGGIRNNAVIPPGPLTEFDTFSILPFGNFVTVIPSISREQFKEIMENTVSRVEFVDGRFAQIAGFSMVYDPAGTAQVLDGDGNVTTAGSRVVDLVLDGGEAIVQGGTVQPGADVTIATIDFLARSGDQYPFRGAAFTSVGVTYQQALRIYLTDALGGVVSAAAYPEGGEGRITTTGAISQLVRGDRGITAGLLGNTPNPFNPSTQIRFVLPGTQEYRLQVFDVAGRRVREFGGVGSRGVNSVTWDGTDRSGAFVASGFYLYQLTSAGLSETRKMLLVK